jgi:hypothetical protein
MEPHLETVAQGFSAMVGRYRREDLGQFVPRESDERVNLEHEHAGLDGRTAAPDSFDFFWVRSKM